MRAQHSALLSEVQEKKRPHTKDWCGAGSLDVPAGAVVGEPVVVGGGRGGAPEVRPDPRAARAGVVGHPVDGVSAEVRAGERTLRRGVGHGGGGLVHRRVGRGGRGGLVRRHDGRGGRGDLGDRLGVRRGRLRGGGLVCLRGGLVHRRGRRRGGRHRRRRCGGERGLVGLGELPPGLYPVDERGADHHDAQHRHDRCGSAEPLALLPPRRGGRSVLGEDHRVGGLRLLGRRRGRGGGLARRRREPLPERLDDRGLEELAVDDGLRLRGVVVGPGRGVHQALGVPGVVRDPRLVRDPLDELL